MDELIERLEKADEGTALLDMHIALSLGTAQPDCSHPYTRSLDAALTLVPTGPLGHRMCTMLECYSSGRGNCGIIPFHARGREDWLWSREAATPALALCIAALKARRRHDH